MKKLLVLLFAFLAVVCLVSCNNDNKDNEKEQEKQQEEEKKDDGQEEGEDKKDDEQKEVKVMTYAEFMAAEQDAEVVIEGYVQAIQTYNPTYANVTLYMADADGAYFVYRAPADEALADKLVPGAHIRVQGEKGIWKGEHEVAEGTGVITVLEGTEEVKAPVDASNCVTVDDFNKYINQLVKIDNAIVTKAPQYKWNNSGSKGDDLYIEFSINGTSYSFLIETDLTGSTGELYEAGDALVVGDIVTIEGFMYWYDVPQMQLTKITKTSHKTSYAEFMATEKGDDVVIEGYIQAIQTYNPTYANVTFYMADADGAYFVYRAPADEALAAKLVAGTHVIVKSEKSEWKGEPETTEAVAEITVLADTKEVNAPVDASACVTVDDFKAYINQLVKIDNAIVTKAPQYKWNNSGSKGDDLYIEFSINGTSYSFLIETDLTGSTGELYEAGDALEVNDIVSIEGFMYWYDVPQMQLTKITKTSHKTSYAEFMATEKGDDVVIEGYIQAIQTYNPTYANVTFYMADADGAYFVYRAPADEDLAAKLVAGTHVIVKSEKSEWKGEHETTEAIAEITVLADTKEVNAPLDASACASNEDFSQYLNQLVKIEGAKVTTAPQYKWNNSGSKGDDLYIEFEINGVKYTFLIETDLTGSTGELYETGDALEVDDIVTIEGFMYWYDAPQMQITKITVSTE